MYHHIEADPIVSNYRVSAARFEEQLKLLHDWEYTTITTTMLVDAITRGADLPPRPIIITFDDGNLDNYTVAFPIMQKYGFTGVLYIPYYFIDTENYMSIDQIKEMAAAGWEVGSHSLTHAELTTLTPDRLREEIVDSREKLQELLGVPILTFAYPFGNVGSAEVDYVKFAGYIAGMGATGFRWEQGSTNLFVLQRCEIKETDIVDDPRYFPRFLPWWGDAPFLYTATPTVTAAPSPTQTPSP
jgi:peptidoglycan/xylan/chitin deacetylase (PgdA/CDA1 family)